ncbi:hypothetical protein FZEAL_10702, partial [Fusarium zealandicum]
NQVVHDLSGFDVLVSRCPAHLPSDIQKVKAVFKTELRQLKDVIVFSSLGKESLANKLSGGDYDGDRAWVCWDPNIVNNFRGAEVPPTPSFERYFQPNVQTAGSLMSHGGKPYFLDTLLEKVFEFHLSPSMVGICTAYKEGLSYQEGSVGSETIVSLSFLLGKLVDQEKSGFEFDDAVWCRFREEECGDKPFVQRPAYKRGDMASMATSNHIIDFLTLYMHERVEGALTEFSRYQMASKHDSDGPGLTTFDVDLASYWNNFEKHAKESTAQCDPSSCWLAELSSNLCRDIDACASHWSRAMASKGDYLAKVLAVYEQWSNISPSAREDSPVATTVTSLFSKQTCFSKALSDWELLKASLTFKRYHRRSWFVWQIAGRQLQFIKACSVRDTGSDASLAPFPVVPSIYNILRPKIRGVGKLLSHQTEEDLGDDEYNI